MFVDNKCSSFRSAGGKFSNVICCLDENTLYKVGVNNQVEALKCKLRSRNARDKYLLKFKLCIILICTL